ncbi:MAG: hypothetical protein ACI4XM_06275 [Candidatus Coprovivens sp.]
MNNNFEILLKTFERIICIVLFFVLLFFVVMQKPEILVSVIEKLTELLKISGFDLGVIITTIIMPKLYK